MEVQKSEKNRKILPGGIIIFLLTLAFVSASSFEIAEWKGLHNKTILEEGKLRKETDASLILSFDSKENFLKDSSSLDYKMISYSPSKSEDCKFGNECLEFDGINDYISIQNINPSLNLSGKSEVTISIWTSLEALEDTQEDWILVPTRNYDIRLSIYRSKLYCYSQNKDGVSSQIGKPLIFTENQKWYNLACVFNFNNDLIEYYQSGIKISEESFIGESFAGVNSEILIGKSASNTHFFKGKMQCLQAWDKALTREEIQTINNSNSCNENFLDPKATFKMEDYNKEIINSNNDNNNADMGAFFVNEGKFNGGIKFDGISDSITIENSTKDFHFDNTVFSMAGWFKSVKNDDNLRNMILGKSSGGGTYQWDLEIDAGEKLSANMYQCNGLSVIGARSNSKVNDQNWHHFVAMYNTDNNGENIRLFIDGKESSSLTTDQGTTTNYCNNNAGNVVIGARNQNIPEHLFNGTIDELQLFNRTLNENEIKLLYEGSQHFIYNEANYQSEIHNSLDFINSNNIKWDKIKFEGELEDSSLKYRSSDCNNIESKEFQSSTKESNTFILENATEQCMQFELYLGDTRSLTPSLDSYTINIEEIVINPPLIAILNPKDGSTHNNTKIDLQISVEDLVSQLDSCWYSLENKNTTFNCLSNTTIEGKEGINNLKVYVNNSLNKINMSESTFTIETKKEIKEEPKSDNSKEESKSSNTPQNKETGGSQKGIIVSEQKTPVIVTSNQIKKESNHIANSHNTGTTKTQEEIQTIKIKEKPKERKIETTSIKIPVKFKLSLILITTILGIMFIITTLRYTHVRNIKPKIIRNKIQEIIDSVTKGQDSHSIHRPRSRIKIY